MAHLKNVAMAILATLLPLGAAAQCGGSFDAFKTGLVADAAANGISPAVAERFLSGVRQDLSVLKADRAQGVFQRPFIDFSRRLISQSRIEKGRQNARAFARNFERIEQTYGLDRHVLLAFWAFETDYGAFQGNFNTANALVTLAHDCRRPELFRPQVFAAMELFAQGNLDPARAPLVHGLARSGWSRCSPKTFLKTGWTGMAMGPCA